jgi:hypothetical protein
MAVSGPVMAPWGMEKKPHRDVNRQSQHTTKTLNKLTNKNEQKFLPAA